MKILGFTGLAGSGKDTAAEILGKENSIYSYAFADPIYHMINSVFEPPKKTIKKGRRKTQVLDKDGIVKEAGVTFRQLIQTLGTEWGRNIINQNIWINLADIDYKDRDKKECSTLDFYIFTDVRFDNEAEYIKSLGGKIIEINRKGSGTRGHASEKGIDDSYIDHRIGNNGSMKEFKERVIRAVDSLGG